MKKKRGDFLERLRDAIRADGRSTYAIAKATKVKPSTLYRFLAGERGIRGETIAAVADELGLELVKKGASNNG
jgi:DNA-binding phage protein